ncbi:MAG: hypothetical protein QOK72_04735 [Nitrososphaeraceae archaeon]|nr:hypothetical protein [Nitrososphaeraceae archaeon]
MLFEGNLRIMGRNILIKFFGRTTYNKEFIELRRYEKNGRIANNCQSIFDADPYFLSC